MADKYDSNGDYNNYSGSNSSDFKRKSTSELKDDSQDGENEDANPSSQKAVEYVRELLSEKISLDQGKWPNAARLIDQGRYLLFETMDIFYNKYRLVVAQQRSLTNAGLQNICQSIFLFCFID